MRDGVDPDDVSQVVCLRRLRWADCVVSPRFEELAMGAIAEKVRRARERLSGRKSNRSETKTERAKRKAEGVARRNEHHRSHGGDHAPPPY